MGTPKSSTSTQSSKPSPQALDAYKYVGNVAQSAAQQPLQQYQGPTVAGFTPQQQAAFQQVQDASGVGNPYINTASQLAAQGSAPQSYIPSVGTGQIGSYGNVGTSQVGTSNISGMPQVNNQNVNASMVGAAPQINNQQVGTSAISGIPQVGYNNVSANNISGIPQVNNQAINAQNISGIPHIDNQQVNASMIGNTPQVGTSNSSYSNYNPDQFSQQGVSQFYNPYQQDVINTTMANIQHSDAMAQNDLLGRAISSGANPFGGDRAGLAQAELARGQAASRDQVLSQLANQGYNTALGAFQSQQGLNTQAGLQNAGQNLNAAQTNAANQLTSSQANAANFLTGAQANQQAGLQAGLANATNDLSAQGSNQQMDYNSALANQGANLAAQGQNAANNLSAQNTNAGNFLTGAQSNQAANLQAGLANQGAGIQTGLANQSTAYNTAAQNAANQLTASGQNATNNQTAQTQNAANFLQQGALNQSAGLQAGLANATNNLSAQTANQNVALTAAQQNAANQLAASTSNAANTLSASGQNANLGYNAAAQNAANTLASSGQNATNYLNTEQNNATNAFTGANQFAGLGQQAQNQALTGASALLQTGGLQQSLNQQQLNVPYQQFQQQQQYPMQQAQFLINALSGNPTNLGSTQTTTTPGPSPLNALAGIATAGIGALPGIRRGGVVGRADGGTVGQPGYFDDGGAASPYTIIGRGQNNQNIPFIPPPPSNVPPIDGAAASPNTILGLPGNGGQGGLGATMPPPLPPPGIPPTPPGMIALQRPQPSVAPPMLPNQVGLGNIPKGWQETQPASLNPTSTVPSYINAMPQIGLDAMPKPLKTQLPPKVDRAIDNVPKFFKQGNDLYDKSHGDGKGSGNKGGPGGKGSGKNGKNSNRNSGKNVALYGYRPPGRAEGGLGSTKKYDPANPPFPTDPGEYTTVTPENAGNTGLKGFGLTEPLDVGAPPSGVAAAAAPPLAAKAPGVNAPVTPASADVEADSLANTDDPTQVIYGDNHVLKTGLPAPSSFTNSPRDAFFEAGATMAASQSPFPLQAIGEGAAKGIEGYVSRKHDNEKMAAEQALQREQLQMQRDQLGMPKTDIGQLTWEHEHGLIDDAAFQAGMAKATDPAGTDTPAIKNADALYPRGSPEWKAAVEKYSTPAPMFAGPKAYDEAQAKKEAGYEDNFDTLMGQRDTLDTMKSLLSNDKVYTGVGADQSLFFNKFIAALGGDPTGAAGQEAFVGLSNKAVLDSLGGSLGTGVSNADRGFIADTVPSLYLSKQGNMLRIEIASRINARKMETSQLAQKWYADHGKFGAEWSSFIDGYAKAHPLFSDEEKQRILGAKDPKAPRYGAPDGPVAPGFDKNWHYVGAGDAAAGATAAPSPTAPPTPTGASDVQSDPMELFKR